MTGTSTTATVKAYLETERGVHIPCRFNPADLTMTRANRWTADAVVGRAAPDLYFTGGLPGRLAMTLVFDTTDDGAPVTDHTDALVDLLRVDPDLPGHENASNRGRPPWVKFHWGDVHSFKSVLERLNLKFTFFSSTGVPLRARAALSLKQFEPERTWPAQNPTSGTPRPHRVHQVQRGETLDRIAALHYGDPAQWRLLAEANRVIDPFVLEPGTVLVVPRLTGAPRAAGR